MTAVNVSRVEVLNNPSSFSSPFSFEIEYEAFCELQEDLEFKMIYVGGVTGEYKVATLD
jgi:histone chaperone ASF1